MPRKSNAGLRAEPEQARRLEDLGEDAMWKRRRGEREARDERHDAKRVREERQ